MLFIHTGDLHLGKTLHERDLHDEQEAMLEALLALVAQRRPAALLMAGDLYDRAIPSPRAIALLDSFLSRLVDACSGITVVAIPGNHDSAARLGFGAGLFRRAGIHLRLRAAESIDPVLVEAGGERCAVWPLPYLGGGADLGDEEVPGQSRGQAELFAAALGRMVARFEEGRMNVLLAHCFATGGRPSESERAFVGLAEEVDASLFDAFDYAALGHLHRPQSVGARARYPGSPLAYSFGEAAGPGGEAPERGFLAIDLSTHGCEVEFLPHRPLRRLVRLEGAFDTFFEPGAFAGHRGDLVEIRLTDPLPVLDPTERLRSTFPNLLAVRQAAFEIRLSAGDAPVAELDVAGDPGDPGRLLKDFALFHRELRGEEAGEEVLALLGELAREAAHEAD